MSTPQDPELINPGGEKEEPVSNTADVQSDAQAPDVSAEAPHETKAEKKNAEPRLTEVDVKFLRAFRNLTSDEDKPGESGTRISLRSILGGDILSGEWFQKQIWYILMLVVMIIFYTSNRYACQQEILETNNLNVTLLDRRY